MPQRAVIQLRARGPVQRETHPQNDEAPCLLLEQAVAITERTGLQIEFTQLTGLAVQRGQAGEHVADLHTVGSDVLDRRRPHGSGDKAQVFQAGQPQLEAVQHERMPGLAGFRLDDNPFTVIG